MSRTGLGMTPIEYLPTYLDVTSVLDAAGCYENNITRLRGIIRTLYTNMFKAIYEDNEDKSKTVDTVRLYLANIALEEDRLKAAISSIIPLNNKIKSYADTYTKYYLTSYTEAEYNETCSTYAKEIQRLEEELEQARESSFNEYYQKGVLQERLDELTSTL